MEGPAVKKDVKFNWKYVTSFGPTAPVLSENVNHFADEMRIMTDGAMDIKTFGAGELVPAFGVFDAVKEGSIEMFHSASYYWAGKVPATQYTCSVPFGMNVQQTQAWFYGGGGKELWQEFYEKHNLMVFPAGNTGVQMGGWFKKEIKNIGDYDGLKMRIPGLGGKVVAAVGGTVVLLAGPDIYPSLERGVIDATEWVGPLYDFNLGLHQAAKYYYSPGWHEPSTNNETSINLKAWNSLPKDIQKMFELATFKQQAWGLAQFDARNGEFLDKLIKYGTQFRQFPDDVLKALFKAAEKINEQVADSDPVARKVYDHYKNFRDQVRKFHNLNEVSYQNALKSVGAI
ncbi:MAG: ABC transporter substrate-binding protein [SAR324 cluster bacterium]|nr:ABC transporter substrate-binding protein [SAR324 cluster bacterium]MCZ6841942.1 ABC transporter substrate-binding protein [SAR324 cluster bacterium]